MVTSGIAGSAEDLTFKGIGLTSSSSSEWKGNGGKGLVDSEYLGKEHSDSIHFFLDSLPLLHKLIICLLYRIF